MPRSPTSDTYRFRAEQMRILAEITVDCVARRIMLQCADDYERMAAARDRIIDADNVIYDRFSAVG